MIIIKIYIKESNSANSFKNHLSVFGEERENPLDRLFKRSFNKFSIVSSLHHKTYFLSKTNKFFYYFNFTLHKNQIKNLKLNKNITRTESIIFNHIFSIKSMKFSYDISLHLSKSNFFDISNTSFALLNFSFLTEFSSSSFESPPLLSLSNRVKLCLSSLEAGLSMHSFLHYFWEIYNFPQKKLIFE